MGLASGFLPSSCWFVNLSTHRLFHRLTADKVDPLINNTNVFVKPNEQCRACSDIVMARKRTFRGTRKELSEVAYNPLSFSNGVVNTMCLVKD